MPNSARSSEPEVTLHFTRILGTGAANPTKEVGAGITVTRTSEGLYKYTWRQNPGKFVNIVGHCFGDTTPGDVKAHTISRDTYSESTFSIEVNVWDGSAATDDLDATEYLDVTFAFKSYPV